MGQSYWDKVQRIERKYHEAKDPANIREINLVYWKRILETVGAVGVTFSPSTRVLDAGCGGAGILLAVPGGIRTGVDPLMGFYLGKFPFLRDEGIHWVEGTAEDFASDAAFDVIFSINMLDHTIDPRASAANLSRLLAPGGRLVLVLNAHLTRFWRRYFALLYRFVDPPHPHHIHRDDVAGLFPSLSVVERRDIDGLWLDIEQRYRGEVFHEKGTNTRRKLRELMNPFMYPLAASRILLDRPFHRRRPDQLPMMASTLWVLTRP